MSKDHEWAPIRAACGHIGRAASVVYRFAAIGAVKTRMHAGKLEYNLDDLEKAQGEAMRNRALAAKRP